jgi:hypothetical protein
MLEMEPLPTPQHPSAPPNPFHDDLSALKPERQNVAAGGLRISVSPPIYGQSATMLRNQAQARPLPAVVAPKHSQASPRTGDSTSSFNQTGFRHAPSVQYDARPAAYAAPSQESLEEETLAALKRFMADDSTANDVR